MDVGPALLIEYTAPAAVVAWLWLRHRERSSPLTLAGAGIAAVGSCSSWICCRAPTWPWTACCGRSRRCSAPRRTSSCPPHAHRRATARPGGRRPRGGRGRPGSARRRRRAADARDDRRADVCGGSCPLVAPVRRPRRDHRRARLHDRHRGEPAARLAAGLVRGAARGRRGGWLRVAAARSAPRPLQLVGGAFVLAGVVVVKLGERPPRATPPTRDPCARPGLRSRPASAIDRAE